MIRQFPRLNSSKTSPRIMCGIHLLPTRWTEEVLKSPALQLWEDIPIGPVWGAIQFPRTGHGEDGAWACGPLSKVYDTPIGLGGAQRYGSITREARHTYRSRGTCVNPIVA